ncbi:hypothetical protein [Thiocystis violascens]|uniref:hypothetical protein n=1 Tax=Thiocystis violascens TaxID=73141 RepID=UPI00022C583F|nr:hypothetical protein [Thiocystis violascens]
MVTLSIDGIGSDALINQLAPDLAIASGSACASGTVESSSVLRAMGVNGAALNGAVRVSFSRHQTDDEVSAVVNRMVAAVQRMRALA